MIPVWVGAGGVTDVVVIITVLELPVLLVVIVLLEPSTVELTVELVPLVPVVVAFPQFQPVTGSTQYESPSTKSVSHVVLFSVGLIWVNRLMEITYSRQICTHVRFRLASFTNHSAQSSVVPTATVAPVGGSTYTVPVDVDVFSA